MSEMLGYARVSTRDQDPQLQIDALQEAGCFRIFTDTASGVLDDRPELEHLLDHLRPGDTLVVWKLDRLGRSMKHLISTVQDLDVKGVGFRSLQETIDTTSAGGKLVFHLFSALAEFERDLISARTRAGLEAARAQGRVGGRPRVMTPEKIAVAREMYHDKKYPVKKIAAVLGVSTGSIYSYLAPPS